MRLIPVIVAAIVVSTSAHAAEHAAAGYGKVREIPVPGPGGWDYLTVDSKAKRLYVSHGTEVVVIDTKDGKVVGTVADTPGVHGIALAPELGRGFASNGRENTVSVFDLATLKTLQKVPTGQNPDAILYEPTTKQVYAFNGRGHSATVIDARQGKVVATIELPGKPEFAVEDAAAGRIYNNIEDKNEVVAIDIRKHAVVATWPIAPGEEASGMAIDLAHHRLFLGCGNKRMVMMDSQTGKVLGDVPIGDHVDANAYDPQAGLAFSSNGEGSMTVARETTPQKLEVVETITTEPGSKTMALDPATHEVFVVAARFEAPPAGAQGGRRQVVPGSMRVLVYAPGKSR